MYEPRRAKMCPRDFRPFKIQTSLFSYRHNLQHWNSGFSMSMFPVTQAVNKKGDDHTTRMTMHSCYIYHISDNTWAVTWDFQQCGILTSLDSDQPVQPPFKLRNSKWYLVSSLTIIGYSSDKQRLWSDCTYAQADLRHCWSHIPHWWKSHVAAHLILIMACFWSRRVSVAMRDWLCFKLDWSFKFFWWKKWFHSVHVFKTW